MEIIHQKDKGWIKVEEKDNKTIITPLSELTNKSFKIKSQHRHRTLAQNRSIHLYCQMVSDSLNNAGYSVNSVLNRKRNKKIAKAFKNAKEWLKSSRNAIRALNRLEEIIFQEEKIELSWTMGLVKDIIWRKIQMALYKDKASTTQLKNDEVTEVYRNIDIYLSTRIGIDSIEFPSWENLKMKEWLKNN